MSLTLFTVYGGVVGKLLSGREERPAPERRVIRRLRRNTLLEPKALRPQLSRGPLGGYLSSEQGGTR